MTATETSAEQPAKCDQHENDSGLKDALDRVQRQRAATHAYLDFLVSEDAALARIEVDLLAAIERAAADQPRSDRKRAVEFPSGRDPAIGRYGHADTHAR